MRIHSLSLTDFGCWQNLSLGNLSGHINVLHGPNEAGKSTLMHFLRGMFYGHYPFASQVLAEEGSQEKNPPVGILGVETATGKYRVERTFSLGARPVLSTGGVSVESLVADESQETEGQGASATTLQVLLSGVDAAMYQNVFAFGLDEMEAIGVLGQTEAGDYLYDLSAGVDRVSLARVFRSLNSERDALLDSTGEGEIARLLEEQGALQAKRDEVAEELGRYRSLISERGRLEGKLQQLDSSAEEEKTRAAICDLAAALRPSWEKMQEASASREALGVIPEVTEAQFLALEELDTQENFLREQSRSIEERIAEAAETLRALPLREAMLRDGPEIEALLAQRPWIASRAQNIDRFSGEQSSSQRQARAESLELGVQVQEALPRLRNDARALKEARAVIRAAEAAARDHPLPVAEQEDEDAAAQLQAVEERAADLKRRIQLEQRLLQLSDTRQDLELQFEGLLQRKVLSVRVLLVSGSLFSLGVMLACSGLFLLSVATWGGILLTLTGIGGSVAGGWLKRMLQRAEDREWDAAERQRELLASQQQQAEADCQQIDQRLDDGRGPYAVQLREAEKQCATLQQAVAQQRANAGSREVAEKLAAEVAEAKAAYQEARRAWQRSLHAEGLPAKLSPAAVRRLAARCREEAEVEKRNAALRAEAVAQQEELAAIGRQVEALLEKAHVAAVESHDLSVGQLLLSKIDLLAQEWSEQTALFAERKQLRGLRWGLAREHRQCRRQLKLLQQRKARTFIDLGLSASEDLQQLAQTCATARGYEAEIASRKAEMVLACGTTCEFETVVSELDGVTEDQLRQERERIAKQRKKTGEKIVELAQQRARLGEQLLSLANDRRDAYLQLELSRVEARLETATSRWRDLVCTAQLLDSIRRCYEQQRQPAALQEASVYLDQMTDGRYRRVWTRLDREMLCVDDFQGRSLPASSLSRGTREPLMLALRLALVSQFARRGIRMPLVLDDILVHFDAERARLAVTLLQEFASAGGHQIFFFTCHKHLVTLLTEMGAEVRLLPETRARTDKAASDHSQAA